MMDIRDRRSVKDAAVQSLSAAEYDPKKLILLHTGAVLLLSLLLTVVDYLLENAIADTGGLSGMGTRSILSTVQSCLRIGQMVALPFWQMGYTFVTMGLARRQRMQPLDLAAGFKLFFPVLRLLLLQGALYFVIAMISSYLGSFLFVLTPWSAPLTEAALALMNSGSMDVIDAAIEAVIADAVVPLMVCYLIVFLALAAPVFYRFRMANFVLLDAPEKGALHALRTSRSLMRGNTMTLFKLDVSFWWFYGLDLLVSILGFADTILMLLGVTLPVSADAAFFASLGIYLICQLALYWWRRNEVSTAYVLIYDALQQPQPKPVPHNQPWTY